MKQQESNLFDKGMSLDTNPIAMDNHTLSGALNATMITMNGNELVLQNDMGNARVETAYLPDGFVPVGMKEHGGIVYVASYNPISDQSLIGSFPSPERNISNDDIGQNPLLFNKLGEIVNGEDTQEVTITYEREAVKLGDLSNDNKNKDIIRPGDQIAFFGSIDDKLKLYANLSAIIVDSDNNAIDVSDNLLKKEEDGSYSVPSTQPENIPYYKGKISGKLFLVETLKLPNYVTVKIGGTKIPSGSTYVVGEQTITATTDTITLTLTPAVDEESVNFLSSYSYNLVWSGVTSSNENPTSFTDGSYKITGLPLTGILTYTVTLKTPYGKIMSMLRKGSIDLSKVGTGDVDFKYFFYYNDIKREQMQIDYDLIAYLKDDLELTNCYLDLVEVNLNNADMQIYDDSGNDSNITHRIELPINSMAGNFSAIIPYGSGSDGSPASTLAMGKMYFGKLKVVESLTVNSNTTSEIKSAKTPILIITSSVTNEYYMENSTGDIGTGEKFMSMLSAQASKAVEILLDCEVNWSEQVKLNISKLKSISGFTNDSAIITEQDADYDNKTLVQFGQELDTNVLIDITPTMKMKYPDESFPLTEKLTLIYPQNLDPVTCSSDLTWTFSLSSVKTTLEDPEGYNKTLESAIEVDTTITNSGGVVTEQSRQSVNNKLRINFNNKLFGKFYGILGQPESYFNNDCEALVPYMNSSNLFLAEELVGCSIYLNKNRDINSMRPENWFTFETWESGKNDRAREVALMHAPDWYITARDAGDVPEQGETNVEGSTGLFLTTSTNANWNFYSKTIIDYYHNNLGIYPTILFISGSKDGGTGLKVAETDLGMIKLSVSTQDYAIPVLLSTSDELYLLNEWDNFNALPTGSNGTGSGITATNATNHPLYTIVDKLSKIYILQSGQIVEFNYKKTEDYAYIMPYTVSINIPVKAELELEFENYYFTTKTTNNGVTTTTTKEKQVKIDNVVYTLPRFKLRNNIFSYESGYSVASPDLYSDVEQYISAEVELGSCGLTPDGVLITVDHNGKRLDSSHPYFFELDENNKPLLIDCYEEEVSKSNNGVANALYKQHLYIMIKLNVNTNYRSIYVNKTNLAGALEDYKNCNRAVGGNEGKLTEYSDVAPKHILKPLFGLRQSLKVTKYPQIAYQNAVNYLN